MSETYEQGLEQSDYRLNHETKISDVIYFDLVLPVCIYQNVMIYLQEIHKMIFF